MSGYARRFQLSSLLGAIALIIVTSTLTAQTVIPSDPKFPSPDHFSFQGTWKCADSSKTATLEIVGPGTAERQESNGFANNWTEVVEKDQTFAGHYFVGYDRDKRQFVIVDADDPAYAAYSTKGWRQNALILISVKSPGQAFPEHRFSYHIEGSDKFLVIVELKEKAGWIMQSSFRCQKIR